MGNPGVRSAYVRRRMTRPIEGQITACGCDGHGCRLTIAHLIHDPADNHALFQRYHIRSMASNIANAPCGGVRLRVAYQGARDDYETCRLRQHEGIGIARKLGGYTVVRGHRLAPLHCGAARNRHEQRTRPASQAAATLTA